MASRCEKAVASGATLPIRPPDCWKILRNQVLQGLGLAVPGTGDDMGMFESGLRGNGEISCLRQIVKQRGFGEVCLCESRTILDG